MVITFPGFRCRVSKLCPSIQDQARKRVPAQVLNPSRGRVRSPASPLSPLSPSSPSICSGLLGLISWRNTVTCSTSSARSNPRSVSLVALSRFCSGLSRERRRQNQRHRQRHIIVSFSFYFLGIASRIEGKTWLDSDRTQVSVLGLLRETLLNHILRHVRQRFPKKANHPSQHGIVQLGRSLTK